MYTPDEIKQHLREAADHFGMPLDEIVLPTERRLPGRGPEINHLDWGTDGRPPILFLHGRALTSHTWDLVCLAMRTEYHCRALDLRGHGDSDWAEDLDYSLDAHCADLESVVDALGLDRFILVGMSLGGATSLTYAGRHADKLAALVVVDTGPETRTPGGRRLASFTGGPREHDSFEDFVRRALEFNPLRRPELLRRSLHHNLRETIDGKWTWKWDHRLNDAAHSPELRERRKAMLREAIPRITCPTLVLRGSKSDLFHDEDAEALAAALPDGRWLRIEGATHNVQGDQPKAFVEAVRPFFAEAAGRLTAR